MSDICTFLEWDTEFFGERIGRVNESHLSSRTARTVDEWAQAHQIDCLYHLIPSDDISAIQVAESYQYRLQDIRITFEQRLNISSDNQITDMQFRHYQSGDLDYLLETAQSAYMHSRFYADPHFSDEKCAELYEIWLRKSCETDYADTVVIAEYDGKAAGYVTCHLNHETKTGNIGLVGVTEAARGKKLGKRLVDFALQWFQEQGMEQVAVVTQGRNIAAQRLYQRCGFVTQSVQLWYHKWFNKNDEGLD